MGLFRRKVPSYLIPIHRDNATSKDWVILLEAGTIVGPSPDRLRIARATLERRVVKKYNILLRAQHYLVVEGFRSPHSCPVFLSAALPVRCRQEAGSSARRGDRAADLASRGARSYRAAAMVRAFGEVAGRAGRQRRAEHGTRYRGGGAAERAQRGRARRLGARRRRSQVAYCLRLAAASMALLPRCWAALGA